MKKLLFTGIFAALMLACFAQKPYKVVFYNLENLFDTINDPEKLDDEFTPEGPKKWNTAKYNKKLGNIEKVLADITAVGMGDRLSVADYPVVIGVSEIENRSVLEDLVSMRKLAPARYRICHYDSPDRRGVDVAFVYRADVFRLEGSAPAISSPCGAPSRANLSISWSPTGLRVWAARSSPRLCASVPPRSCAMRPTRCAGSIRPRRW